MESNAKELYLPEGNEARLKAAYSNRYPCLAFNVVTPFAIFKGVNSNSTADGMYTFRFLLQVNIMLIHQEPNLI
ncbi:MAG: hypothetical protein IPH58_05730 [Sphingobacteriales bacterium]|nr:hypothetical protein [Sphingobacteriales bacterium]